jgi:GNAT superfamily N-acetyltransferase
VVTIEKISGPLSSEQLTALASLRIRVFKDFPYLYEGDMEYEKDYLETFVKAKDSLLLLVRDEEKVVGASTGLPLHQETSNIYTPWVSAGYDIDTIFYFGESVLDPSYRGRGIGVKFFEEREAFAKSLGQFDRCAFCGVIRPERHPLKPKEYASLDAFWKKRGYRKMEDLICEITWKDIGEENESPKPLQFWSKEI